jgi:hypothetical protein
MPGVLTRKWGSKGAAGKGSVYSNPAWSPDGKRCEFGEMRWVSTQRIEGCDTEEAEWESLHGRN